MSDLYSVVSEAQLKRLIVQSARNLRRAHRAQDSQGEMVERWLDRVIERKTRITRSQAQGLVVLWEAFVAKLDVEYKAVEDFLDATAQ